MDININVRLQQYKQTSTSSSRSISNKKGRTRASARTDKVDSDSFLNITSKNKLGSILGLKTLGMATAVMVAGKVANTANTVQGMVTNNRFRQKRQSDLIRTATNPVGFFAGAYKKGLVNQYDVFRENEQRDYRRQMAGMYLPFRNGNQGSTL